MKNLNPKQQEAVHHIEGPLLVLAGAGSGKTHVVTTRIAHLLQIGVPSSEILAVTFTNKAAGEMRRRVEKQTDQSVLATTFHSLSARILRESIQHLGYKNSFAIYDEKDSEQLVKTCIDMLGYKVEKGMVKTIRSQISQSKNDLLSPQDAAQTFTNPQDAFFVECYTAYQQKLKEYNALDFDDLLFLTVRLFREHPAVLAHYQKRWNFVLVDEYQDTNAAQYEITALLVKEHRNLCVVGDPDQSIYSWRGANIQNILNFETDFPGAKIIKLEQNYRSTENILNAANALIANNSQRYKKKLWSELGAGELINVFFAHNEKEEAEFVLKQIDSFRNEGLSLNDMVIFYRTNAQSRSFEDILMRYNVPYTIVGGISFYQRREIKDVVALLRLLISDSDFLSFLRVINLPKRGFGGQTLTKLQKLSEELQEPILSLCEEILHGHVTFKLSKKQRDGLYEFLDTIKSVRRMVDERAPLQNILVEVVERSSYLNYLQEDKDTFSERRENIDELINKASEWDDTLHLRDFLEDISLKAQIDEVSASLDSVKLMTIHNGKGLEYDVTFLVGMEEELFPHVNSKDNFEQLEEERRLAYVGMTRAKKHLYLTGSTFRTVWGTPKVMSPSRFLDEVPEQYIRYLNKDKLPEVAHDDVDELKPGTEVYHKNFGSGIIQRTYNTSHGEAYDILFKADNSVRSIIAKYAKLTTSI